MRFGVPVSIISDSGRGLREVGGGGGMWRGGRWGEVTGVFFLISAALSLCSFTLMLIFA